MKKRESRTKSSEKQLEKVELKNWNRDEGKGRFEDVLAADVTAK